MHSSKKKELSIKLPLLEHLNRTTLSKDETVLWFRLLARCSQLLNFLSDATAPSQQELDLLFGPLYDEFFTTGTSSVNKSSSPTDNSKQDTPPTTNIQSSTEPTTLTTKFNAEENNDNQEEDTQFQQDEFINPFYTPAKYALEILKKHGMDKCDSIGTPMATKPKLDADLSGKLVDQTDHHSKIGSLMYLTSSKPDIYPKDSGFELTAFSDDDHTGCLDTRKSTSRGIQFLGDKLVSWMSKKQDCTAMSSAEVEYVALSASCAQVMWMRTQLKDYGFNYNKIPLYCDSQSAIAISCNPVQHSRTKHIHTSYHFIKERVKNGIIELYSVRTEYQLADMFIKSLPEDRFLVDRIPTTNLISDDSEDPKVVRLGSKKQKGDDDQEEAEMKRHIEIVKDDEVAIDAYTLVLAPGIDREDLETLWKLVKAKHENTRPEDDYERVLWGDLKVAAMVSAGDVVEVAKMVDMVLWVVSAVMVVAGMTAAASAYEAEGGDVDDGGVVVVRGMVMMMTVVAGCGCRRGWRRVAASGYGDRVDRVMRITFGFGRNARRKTFSAAAAWWPAAGRVAGYFWERER
ncbi:retrovirus-related pol polyprotein from transposon TNT 1-94 [Tanacetum coccineum]